MRILVTGSRDWNDWQTIRAALYEIIFAAGTDVTVVHGGAKGADQIAGTIARGFGVKVEEHRAHWRPNGVLNRRAGLERNEHMIALGADICLAFWKGGSTGTGHCITKAREAGINVVVFTEE